MTRRGFNSMAASGMTAALLRAQDSIRFEDCYAEWQDASLTMGNRYVERKWLFAGDQAIALSTRDKESGTEWTSAPKQIGGDFNTVKFSAKSGASGPVEAPSLVVETRGRRFQIFPEGRGVSVETSLDGAEEFTPPPANYRFIQVTLFDQTDIHNELVFENEWLLQTNEGAMQLQGNVFVVENTVTHAGLVYLKQAPLPHARPVKRPYDAEVVKRKFRFPFDGYAYTMLTYSGGAAGRTAALRDFQRHKRLYEPKRDGMFLSNTWGDRSRDKRINAEFMAAEVEAGAKLGVDVIQIDDGWQKGRTINSVLANGKGNWQGYWAADPDFWQPDPQRFPQGLEPLVKMAKAKGMRFGLWFGPDSSNDFANWQRDANRLMELHKSGIDYFKLDSVKAVSAAGEQNLRRLFDRVLSESKGRVAFDLDVTAEIRPGYFGALQTGPLFVENRYTDFHGYWPHQTLRNLWKLAHYVDPLRLRMEVLNNTRNTQLYAGDPLAPSVYSPEYLFATVMVASPLGWFEISNLPAEYAAGMAKMVSVWKRHREAMYTGVLTPVGTAPDGLGWTGFAWRKAGYALLFRGIQCGPTWTEPFPGFRKAEVLGGNGSAEIVDGALKVTVPAAPGFAWVALS